MADQQQRSSSGVEEDRSNNSSNLKSLTPKSSRKHRLVADARWRANTYVCYALLKHSSLGLPPAMRTKSGKLTRIAALQQALSQLQIVEEILSTLLQEKNEEFETNETMQSLKEDFITITDEATCRYLDRRKAREIARYTDIDYSSQLSAKDAEDVELVGSEKTGGGVYQSVSRSSLAPSYISDISSTIDGLRSRPHSPTTSSQVEHTDIEWNKEMTDPNSSIQLLDGLFGNSDILDLEVIQQMDNSPVNFSQAPFSLTPKARTKSPSEALLIRTPKCRRLFSDQVEEKNTVHSQIESKADPQRRLANEDEVYRDDGEEERVVPDLLTQTTEDEEYLSFLSKDMELYGESPQSSKYLSSQSDDPLVSTAHQLP